MEKPTFQDFQVMAAEVYRAKQLLPELERWRWGQTAFNVLSELRPDLAEEVRGTDMDPFHDDRKYILLFEFLLKRW